MLKSIPKIKKFLMKWRFRLDQSRTAFSLITFALILAEDYKNYFFTIFPYFETHAREFEGILVFTILIFFAFMVGGYLYDRIFKLWTETNVVGLERNPYSYIPAPKDEILWQGYWAYLFYAIDEIAKKVKVELKWKDLPKYHMEQYYQLKPTTPEFIKKSLIIKEISTLLQKIYIDEDISKEEVINTLDAIKEKMGEAQT